MAYNFLKDVMQGYEFGSQLSKDYEAAQIKRAEDEYWKSVTSQKPNAPAIMPKTKAPNGYVPGKTISGADTMLPKGAMSLVDQATGVETRGLRPEERILDTSTPTEYATAPTTDVNKTSPYGTVQQTGAESPANMPYGYGAIPKDYQPSEGNVDTSPTQSVVDQAMVKDPYAEPPVGTNMVSDAEGNIVEDRSAKPIMTQHMEAANTARNLDNSVEQQKGLIKYLREKGYGAQAAAKEKDLYELQNKAAIANFNNLKYQSLVLDEVGGVLNGYIKMAEKDPANEARYRAIGIRQLQNLGYDANIIASDNAEENIATAKQIYQSTTTAKENTKFEIESRNLAAKEESNRIRNKHNENMDSLGAQKIALGRDKYDSKRATEILRSYDNEVNKIRTQYEMALTKEDKAMFKVSLEKAIAAQEDARKSFKAQATREKVKFEEAAPVTTETPAPSAKPTAAAAKKPAAKISFTDKATKEIQTKYSDAMKRATTEDQRKAITARMVELGYIGE